MAPASRKRPISAISSLFRPLVIAAMGSTLMRAVSRARRMMKSTSATSSITGSVLGMQMMVVTPPAAAARLAVLMPGLAGEHQHVDETWSEHMTAAVDHLRLADGVRGHFWAQIEDLAVLDQHATRLVEAGAWIDQPCIEQGGAAAVVLSRGLHRHQWLGRWRASA